MKIVIDGDGIAKMAQAAKTLSSNQLDRANKIALNRVGGKAFTQVKRTLAKQTGMPQRLLIEKGNLRSIKASGGPDLNYKIVADNQPLSLKYFKARQFQAGSKASPWGVRRLFTGTFIDAGRKGSGFQVGHGHVFKRTGGFNQKSGRNNAIEKLWGPGVGREMVKDATADAFRTVAKQLPKEIGVAVTKITKRVIT